MPIETTPTEHNLAYLRAKRDKLGHRLHHQHLKLQEGMLPSEPPQGVADPDAQEPIVKEPARS